ncbi:MAG: glycine cleavage system aminomethyltransferase GcvT [Clostridia bacterium]
MATKRTPLFNKHQENKAKFTDFGGWEMPLEYTGILDEHHAVRNEAGMFDVSHMGEFEVYGEEATKFLQHLLTNDVEDLSNYGIVYTFMCYEDGGVVDDLLAYKYNSEKYLLVVNAGNIEKDFDWVKKHSENFNVTVNNSSNEVAEVAVQGPKAQEIVQKLTDYDLDDIKFFTFADDVVIAGVNTLISRTGYTGEDGFEIYTKNEDIEKLFDEIIRVGEPEGLKLAGLGARDTLRFEATLPLYGQEISKDITPLEAGLGYFVELDKEFIGQKALTKQKEEGLKRKSVGFEVLGRGLARTGAKVLNNEGEEIGFVTTGYISPTLGKAIGLAIVDSNYTKRGTELTLQVRRREIPAKVISRRFLKKKKK